jgi:ubiquinone/menaquinone biosynthesis C-methylase UbiE
VLEGLKIAKDFGFVDEISAENVEKLSFDDNEIDFVLCKESFHHFPRPFMGLCEMLNLRKEYC